MFVFVVVLEGGKGREREHEVGWLEKWEGSGKRVEAVRVRNWINLALARATEWVMDDPGPWCL